MLYRLLAAGRPVPVAALAAGTGWEPARAESWLERLPHVELDDHRSVVGFGGLTLRPTPHRIRMAGVSGYAWCAWDTLFLPVALGTEAHVASRCPRTNRPVTLRVARNGVVERRPDSVVMSFVEPVRVDGTDLRRSFCDAVHFFADHTAAAGGSTRTDAVLVLDLDDAFELGRCMILDQCGVVDRPLGAGMTRPRAASVPPDAGISGGCWGVPGGRRHRRGCRVSTAHNDLE